ncbi:hypothetical protein S7335_1192 [Synechococcus sp. PCC 7335]|nr:hypothetical protein S7335_1157 [Synechococcus sp. PCC 7335]EDX82488.1 hypothetical protein S7335_1192 [Synechococcus sp. PCC 7335]
MWIALTKEAALIDKPIDPLIDFLAVIHWFSLGSDRHYAFTDQSDRLLFPYCFPSPVRARLGSSLQQP